MKQKWILLAVLLAVSPAMAEFEGVLEMKSTVGGLAEGQGARTMTYSLSRAGTRIETAVNMAGREIKMVMLTRADAPGKMYRIDDLNKTYSVIESPKTNAASAGKQAGTPYAVQKLGREDILGYNTQHVLITHSNLTMELWTAGEFTDSAALRRMQASRGGDSEGFLQALREAGADGMPLKSITTLSSGQKIAMEVVKIDEKVLPASTFEIPAGYTEVKLGGMGGMSGRTPEEARKRMQDAMQRMPPEQRAAMEKAMKARGGAATVAPAGD